MAVRMVMARAMRHFLWSLGLIGLMVGVGVVFYGHTLAGHLIDSVPSPDGKCDAEIRTYGFASAMDTEVIAVRLRCGLSPFRHEVFSGLDYGSTVTVRWTSATEMEIHYRRDRLGPPYKEIAWRDLRIHYVLE